MRDDPGNLTRLDTVVEREVEVVWHLGRQRGPGRRRLGLDARGRNDGRDGAAESCQRSGKPALRAPSTIRSNSLRNVGLSEYPDPSCASFCTVKPGRTLRSSSTAAAASAFCPRQAYAEARSVQAPQNDFPVAVDFRHHSIACA
jgi:hypothetical protein